MTIHFILAVGLTAGLIGWNHPHPETKGMSRFAGLVCGAYALVYWGPAVTYWVLP